MLKNNIILVGAGGHAVSCIDVIEDSSHFQIIGLIGLKNEVNKQILKYKIIGCDEDLQGLLSESKYAFVSAGQIKSSELRRNLFNKILKIGYFIPKIISSNAIISKYSVIAEGSIIMKNTIINARVEIGRNCIINNGAIIEHGVKIKDHCHISTGVIINGDVNVGEGCFIGSHSTIREGLTIGNNSVIGMGSKVVKNINHNQIYMD